MLKQAQQMLQNCSDHPRSDAEIILAYVLGKTREWLIAHAEEEMDDPDTYQNLLRRRQAGEPLAYLCGYQEFYGHSFQVTPAVLIPRPETESIVEHALQNAQTADKVLDVGTGSGALAITLQLENPSLEVHATDISPAALKIAHQNAQNLEASVFFHQTDQFFPPAIAFDLIVTNLPYIPTENPEIQQSVADYEPALALYGGTDGLEIYRAFFQELARQTWQPRFLMCEMGYNQAATLSKIVRTHFPQSKIEIIPDHSGFDRNLILRFN